MIVVDGKNSMMMINGTRAELMTECVMLMSGLLKKGVVDKDSLLFLVEASTKTPEELKKEASKARIEFLKDLMCKNDELKKLLKELEGME